MNDYNDSQGDSRPDPDQSGRPGESLTTQAAELPSGEPGQGGAAASGPVNGQGNGHVNGTASPARSKSKPQPPPRPSYRYKNDWQRLVPIELRERPQWGVWRYAWKNGRWTKVPFQPNNWKAGASSTNPSTWTTFEVAVNAYLKSQGTRNPFDGVGYVFSADDPYVGIDFDRCIGEDGEILEWAQPWLARFQASYGELSPSGTGIKVIVRGRIPDGKGRKKTGFGPDKTGAIEIYSEGRYFTVTGDSTDTSRSTIEDCSAGVDTLVGEVGVPAPEPKRDTPAPSGPPLASDEALLAKARKARNGSAFDSLYCGQVPAGKTPSEADQALCNHLAFWWNRDAAAIDRMFRSSGLMRDKWDEPHGKGGTYGAMTIQKAIGWTAEVYTPLPERKLRSSRKEAAARNGHHAGSNGTPEGAGETTAGTDRQPVDVEQLRSKAAGFSSFADVLRDRELQTSLARLELEDHAEASAIVATIHETLGARFKKRDFQAAMESARRDAKREAYGEPDPLLLGEQVDDPHRLARLFLAQNCMRQGCRTLVRHRDEFHLWDGKAYQLYRDVEADLTSTIKEDFDAQHEAALIQYARAAKLGKQAEKPPTLHKVTASIVRDATLALRSETALPWEEDAPCWIGEGDWTDRNPREILSAVNVLVHLPTRETLPHTPRLFTPFALQYDWHVSAPKPERWYRFLHDELWPGDPASVRELQKWFGLALTLDTSYQKILMLLGPPRSGKGTILRVLTRMIGEHNVASQSLPGLGRPFGLWSLLGKALCVFSDAHAIGSPSDRAIVLETLLRISGEDNVTIDRKYQQPITTKLPTRLIFVGNQEPNFRDSSGALLSRIRPLQLRRSFRGEEDTELTNKLFAELPGILRHFAVDGLDMLKEDGGFHIPDSAQLLLHRMEEILNPTAVFADECIELVKDDKRARSELPRKRDVFAAWCAWCRETKHESGSAALFGRNLLNAAPGFADVESERDTEAPREWRYRGLKLTEEGETLLRQAQSEQLRKGSPY